MIRPSLQSLLEAFLACAGKDLTALFKAAGLSEDAFVVLNAEPDTAVWDLRDIDRIPGLAGLCVHLDRAGRIELIHIGLGEHSSKVSAIQAAIGRPMMLTSISELPYRPGTSHGDVLSPMFQFKTETALIHGIWPGALSALCSHIYIVKAGKIDKAEQGDSILIPGALLS